MSVREKPVEVVIVGMGWAGAVMASELTKAGMQVLSLERGAPMGVEDFRTPNVHDENGPRALLDRSLDTITFRNDRKDTALPVRTGSAPMVWAHGVGGGGVWWGAVSFRASPWEMKVRSMTLERYGPKALPEDCTSQDWPMSWRELEPFFDKFEKQIGSGGKAGNLKGKIIPGGNRFEGPRSSEYPNPAAPPSFSHTIFDKAATSLGYHPYPTPRATMTRPYTNPDGVSLNGCAYCGFCTGHRCEMNAKATPQSTVLPTALASAKFELRTRSMVTRINLDSTGKRATGVTYVDSAGVEHEQPADIVVVTAMVFSTVRLLLLSKVGVPYDPVSGKGAVGKNFSWHSTKPTGQLYYEKDHIFPGFIGAGGYGARIADLQNDNFDHSDLGFIGGVSVGVSSGGGVGGGVPPNTPNFGPEWKKAVTHYYNRRIGFNGLHDSQSYRGFYLDLDPTYTDPWGLPLVRQTYDFHDNERKLLAYCGAKAEEIIKRMEPTSYNFNGRFPDHHGQENNSGSAQHQLGGAIMGASPEDSVVNKYMQVWQTPNLFVVGGANLPQSPAVNPTISIGAISNWCANAITQQYVKSRSLMA